MRPRIQPIPTRAAERTVERPTGAARAKRLEGRNAGLRPIAARSPGLIYRRARRRPRSGGASSVSLFILVMPCRGVSLLRRPSQASARRSREANRSRSVRRERVSRSGRSGGPVSSVLPLRPPWSPCLAFRGGTVHWVENVRISTYASGPALPRTTVIRMKGQTRTAGRHGVAVHPDRD